MKTALWTTGLSMAICLFGAFYFYTHIFHSPNEPWLKSFPLEMDAKINETKDIEHLRNIALFLVRSDREEKKVINAAFQSMIDATIWLFVGLGILNAAIFASIYKALRQKKYGNMVSGGATDG